MRFFLCCSLIGGVEDRRWYHLFSSIISCMWFLCVRAAAENENFQISIMCLAHMAVRERDAFLKISKFYFLTWV